MKVQRKVNVVQSDNPKFDSANPGGPIKPYIYLVESVVNSMEPRIGEWLTESQVQRLIEDGFTVNIGTRR